MTNTSLSARRWGIAVGLLCVLAASGGGIWWWQQQTRPGRVQEQRGRAALAAGQPAQAERDWLKGIRDDPAFPGCYVRLGDFCVQTGQLPWAVHFYGQAVRLAPQDGLVQFKLAQTEQQQGETMAALFAIRRAATLLPHNAAVLSLYGLIASDLNDFTEALSALRQAHALQPDNGTVTVLLAETELDTGNKSGAEQLLAPYAQAHPEDGEGNYAMAVIEQAKPPSPQTLSAALNYARNAFADAPQNVTVAALLGKLYLATNDPQKALRVFQQAHTLRPGAVSPLQGLIACETRLGHTQQAARLEPALQAAFARRNQLTHLNYQLRLAPNNMSLRHQRDRLEQQTGE